MIFIPEGTINFKEIEQKWKKKWEDSSLFEADPDSRKKWFGNAAFPYVNAPLHLGHGFTYTRIDMMARFKRMRGFNVLYPFGFHATGEPIVGVATRLKKGDEKQKKILLDSGVPDKDIDKFKEPNYIVNFWKKRIEQDLTDLGLSIDWRRKFTTIDPEFNQFISWQYRLLRKRGYVIQGTHPVVWCKNCQSPTGDHDRLEGEGESPIEFSVLKFKFGDMYICAATLRPETVFGQTNMWVNPEIDYQIVKVNGKEKWIVSKECTEKLHDQGKKIDIVGSLKGKDMIGKFCLAPKIDKEIIILPSKFCDPNIGTGLVTSVPSHAPYDWIGLEDLKNNPKEIEKYGLDPSLVKNIEPISIIKIEGFQDHPAGEICKQMEIKNQEEFEKLDKALKIIYKKEYHMGVMKNNCMEYSGMKVEEAKEKIKAELKEKGFLETMWEPTGRVICRCGSQCHIKILENQWFLKFSDEEWKNKTRECLKNMKIYPEAARKNFESVIDWLMDKACVRKSGLGTKLPWDKEWIIETLSDSVIYLAYYTIAKYINKEKIQHEKLTDELFDYVFLGQGNKEEVARKTGLKAEIIEQMKKEFEYWYGFDLRGSAKELIPNHLTFCIFHHTAVWDDRSKWPKGMTVNGMLNVEGHKMSKSKGNFIVLKDAIDKYGADTVRIALMDSGEGLDDVNWTENDAIAWKNKLYGISELSIKNYSKGKEREENKLDLWLKSKMNIHVKKITDSLEEVNNRSAVTIIHEILRDLNWYLKRTESPHRKILNKAIEDTVKMLSVFAPFISEETWQRIGKKSLISAEKWPEYNENEIDKDALELEEEFIKVVEDIKHVIKLAGKSNKLYLYTVTDKEYKHFEEGKTFLQKDLGFKEMQVFMSNDNKKYDPEGKSKKAKFGKPGIYVE